MLLRIHGFNVGRAFLFHLNSDHIRQGDLHIRKLFITIDMRRGFDLISDDVTKKIWDAQPILTDRRRVQAEKVWSLLSLVWSIVIVCYMPPKEITRLFPIVERDGPPYVVGTIETRRSRGLECGSNRLGGILGSAFAFQY
jgi:hypothetical protein